jgi:nitric oxide reductase large subunit
MKNIIISFIKQVKAEIKQENKVNHVEEITQNISIMVVSGKSFLQYLPDYKLMCDEIKNFSTMSPKSYPSLTNKIVFKFMDLDDELDD